MSSSTTYDNIKLWLDDASVNLTKIEKYDRIIDALEDAAETAAASGHLEEYMLDDGQSRIKTIYRNITDITTALDMFEALRQRYINRTNGNVVLLRDARGMRYNNPNC